MKVWHWVCWPCRAAAVTDTPGIASCPFCGRRMEFNYIDQDVRRP